MKKNVQFSVIAVVLILCLTAIILITRNRSLQLAYFNAHNAVLKMNGRVVDQYGNGVPGIRYEFIFPYDQGIHSNNSLASLRLEREYTMTDENGYFHYDSSPRRAQVVEVRPYTGYTKDCIFYEMLSDDIYSYKENSGWPTFLNDGSFVAKMERSGLPEPMIVRELQVSGNRSIWGQVDT